MRCILSFALLLVVTQPALPQKTVGLGIFLGNPSGFTVKFGVPSSASVDLLFAWRLDDTFFAQGHYNYKIHRLARYTESEVGLYGGPGIFFRTSPWESDLMGFSGTFGLNWIINGNLELFSELSPKIGLIRSTELDMTGGIGFRYLF